MKKNWNVDITSHEYKAKQERRRNTIVYALGVINVVVAVLALMKAYGLF